MVNILIADISFLEIKRLVNIIVSKTENSKIINISTDFKEACSSITEFYPDIIIKNNSFDFRGILNNDFYTPLIIDSNKLQSQLQLQKIITKLNRRKTEQIQNTQNKHSEFEKLSRKLYNHLIKLNFNPQMIGTFYLSEALAYVYLNKNKDTEILNNFTKTIYPEIGSRNNSTGEAVKWDIIKTINEMYKTNLAISPKTVTNFLNTHVELKPTPKYFITTYTNVMK
ncbi:MAG: hypothetical protein IKF52_07160 [Clostridia bacterium]|nr:hypothetical protein [Clostridia bacterium]